MKLLYKPDMTGNTFIATLHSIWYLLQLCRRKC